MTNVLHIHALCYIVLRLLFRFQPQNRQRDIMAVADDGNYVHRHAASSSLLNIIKSNCSSVNDEGSVYFYFLLLLICLDNLIFIALVVVSIDLFFGMVMSRAGIEFC